MEKAPHMIDSHDWRSEQFDIVADGEPRSLDPIGLCFGLAETLVPVSVHYAPYDVCLLGIQL